MEHSQLNFVLQTLEGPRRLFYYAPDEYARYLAARQVQNGAVSLADFKRSPYGKLLERPNLKAAQANWGDGQLDHNRLQMLRAAEPLNFRITLSRWGAAERCRYNFNQTSRPGFNLVVQLNFGGDHNAEYRQLVRERTSGYHPFFYCDHPAKAEQDFTIAWARIDLSDDLETALIEEVQSDWWKLASTDIEVKKHRQRDASGNWREWTDKRSANNLNIAAMERYLEQTLRPYGKVWEEAMLTATLQVLWEEIGVQRIFYHTYATGCALKNCHPPRSLYTKLPKKFCFTPTREVPHFLQPQVRRLPRKEQERVGFWVI
ncbi:MAG: hypothetical protein AAGJ82_06300 [Bacteroidota bacterium]